MYTTCPPELPGAGGHVPLADTFIPGSSFPFQARRKAGYQPKSEGAAATERGRAALRRRNVYNLVKRSFLPRIRTDRAMDGAVGSQFSFSVLYLSFSFFLCLILFKFFVYFQAFIFITLYFSIIISSLIFFTLCLFARLH